MLTALMVGFVGVHALQYGQHRPWAYTPPRGVLPLSGKSQVDRTVYGFYPYWESSAYQGLDYDLLSHIAWFAVSLNSRGDIKDYNGWPGSWAGLVDSCHAHGVKLHMTATCFNADTIRSIVRDYPEQGAHTIVSAAISGGADGVNIDFEMPYSADSLLFLNFIRILSDSCASRGLELVLCVGAVNWNNRFLVDRIAPAVDGVFIMGYDYFWSGSPTTGPVAPLVGYNYNVTKSVDYYVNYAGGPEKIILGVPYYGFRWAADGPDPGANTQASGTAVTYSTAVDETEMYGLLWHDYSETPWYRYYSSGWHQVWFDNDSSLGLKYDLALDRDLQGIGIWALGYDGDKEGLWRELERHFFLAQVSAEIRFYPQGQDTCLITCYRDPGDSVVWTGRAGTGPVSVPVRGRGTYDLAFQASPGFNSVFVPDLEVVGDTFLGTVFLWDRDSEFVIDNLDPECYISGPWTRSELTPGYWGLDYLWTDGSSPAEALFMPGDLSPGHYKLYLWFTSGPNRAPDAPVLVRSSDGDTLLRVDETQPGERWVYLGEFNMGQGSYVKVFNGISDPGRVVVADAVAFTPRGSGAPEGGESPPLSLIYSPARKTILASSPARARLRLYDVSGRRVRSVEFQGTTRVSLSGMGAGIYFATLGPLRLTCPLR